MSQRRARHARQTTHAERQARSRRRLVTGRRLLAATGVLALISALVVGIVAAKSSGPAEPIVQSGTSSVSFSGTDPITGEAISLADYAGKPVVINVWGSWCPGCVAEAEDLRRFGEDHPEVQLIGVDLQDSRSAAKEFYERWRWTHPSVFDPDGEISFSLGLQGTPSTFFLDRDHRVVTRIVGETDYAGFERGLVAALGQS